MNCSILLFEKILCTSAFFKLYDTGTCMTTKHPLGVNIYFTILLFKNYYCSFLYEIVGLVLLLNIGTPVM